MSFVTVMIILAVAVGLYFMPALVAALRGHRQFWPIFVIDLFLGWTFLGWIVALAMAASYIERADADAVDAVVPPPAAP